MVVDMLNQNVFQLVRDLAKWTQMILNLTKL